MLKQLLKNERGEASGGARLLVILYAAAIVVLGWQPLSKGRGSLMDSLSSATAKIANSFSKERQQRNKVTEKIEVEIPAVPLKAAMPETTVSKQTPVDKLTDKDRKELNSLIDDL